MFHGVCVLEARLDANKTKPLLNMNILASKKHVTFTLPIHSTTNASALRTFDIITLIILFCTNNLSARPVLASVN